MHSSSFSTSPSSSISSLFSAGSHSSKGAEPASLPSSMLATEMPRARVLQKTRSDREDTHAKSSLGIATPLGVARVEATPLNSSNPSGPLPVAGANISASQKFKRALVGRRRKAKENMKVPSTEVVASNSAEQLPKFSDSTLPVPPRPREAPSFKSPALPLSIATDVIDIKAAAALPTSPSSPSPPPVPPKSPLDLSFTSPEYTQTSLAPGHSDPASGAAALYNSSESDRKNKEDWRKSDSTQTSSHTIMPSDARPRAESPDSTLSPIQSFNSPAQLSSYPEQFGQESLQRDDVEPILSRRNTVKRRSASLDLAELHIPSDSSSVEHPTSVSDIFPERTGYSDSEASLHPRRSSFRASRSFKLSSPPSSGFPREGFQFPSSQHDSTSSGLSHGVEQTSEKTTGKFRQTAISFTTTAAVLAGGLRRRAAERVGRVLGAGGHNSSSSSSSIGFLLSGGNRSRTSSAQDALNTHNRTPNAPSGAWSVHSVGSSSEFSETRKFPSLGTVVREPIRMSGGIVFGRPLIECVRDTRYEGAVSSAQETGSFYVPSLLEDRMIPSLIFRCVKHLQLWGIEEEGVFRISGRASHIQKLKAEFDSGADYDLSECSPSELDPHAVASIFKTYFRELPETILTRPLSGSFDLIMSMEKRINPLSQSSSSLRRVVQRSPSGSTLSSHSLTPSNSNPDDLTLALSALIYRLPRENRDLLKTLTELITETASKSAINKMHLDNLLLIFCPTLGMKPALLRLLCQNEQIWMYTEPDQSNQTLHRAASSSSDAAHHDVEAQADSDNTLSESSSARSLHDSIQEDESSGEIGSYGPHLRARRTHGRRVPVPAMLAEDVVPDSVSLLDEVLSESSHQSHESQVSSTYPLSTNSAGSPVHPTVREPVDAQSSESANLNIPPPSPSEGASVYHSEDHTLHVQIPDTTPPAVNLELESSRPVTLYLDPCTEIPSLPSSPISPISPPTPTLPKARLIDRSSFKKRLSFLQITPAENSNSSPHSPKTGSSQDDLKSPSSIHSGPSTPSGLHHALSFPFLRSSKTAPLSASPLASSPASEGRRLSRRSSLGMFFGKRNNSELEAIVDHSSLTSGARIGPLPPFLTLPLESPGLRIGFGIDENVAEDSHGYTDVPALPQEPTIIDQKQVHPQGSVSDVPSSTAHDLTLSVPQATSKAPRIALQTYSPLESNWAESVLSATHSHS